MGLCLNSDTEATQVPGPPVPVSAIFPGWDLLPWAGMTAERLEVAVCGLWALAAHGEVASIHRGESVPFVGGVDTCPDVTAPCHFVGQLPRIS